MTSASDSLLEQARIIHEAMGLMRSRFVARHVVSFASNGVNAPSFELTMGQMNMVLAVWDRKQATIKELAEALRVSPSSASIMVDRLVEAGVLSREHSQVDRREVIVRVMPSIEVHLQEVERELLQSLVEIVEKIGPQYGRMWCEACERVIEAVRPELARPSARESSVNGHGK